MLYIVTMPTAQHETPIALAKLDPSVVAWLLSNLFEVKVPDYRHTHTQATDVRVIVPRTYHADGMLVYSDGADRPVLAAVLEVQRAWDMGKRRTWRLYVAQLEAELDTNVALVVYCPEAVVARRYRDLFEFDGISLLLRPLIFTPQQVPMVIDEDLARANPTLAVLSALCHGDSPTIDAMFPALSAALQAVGPKNAISYNDIVLAGLSETARVRWEAFMTTTASQYLSERFRDIATKAEQEGRQEGLEKGRAEGEALGKAEAVLAVLDLRGVDVHADARDQILGCTDMEQLAMWLHRAIVATTIGDVLRS